MAVCTVWARPSEAPLSFFSKKFSASWSLAPALVPCQMLESVRTKQLRWTALQSVCSC